MTQPRASGMLGQPSTYLAPCLVFAGTPQERWEYKHSADWEGVAGCSPPPPAITQASRNRAQCADIETEVYFKM